MRSEVTEDWLCGRLLVSEPMCRALGLSAGGIEQRVLVLDRLAAAHGIDADRLGDAGYELLGALLDALEQEMALGPGSWVTDTGRHRSVARAAVEGTDLGTLLTAAAQFGWQRHRLDAERPTLGEVEGLVTEAMVTRLAQRVFGAMERWRKAGAWAAVRG